MTKGLAPAASVSDVLKDLSVKENVDVQKPWERPPLPESYEAKPCIEFQKIDIAESSSDLETSEIHLFGITKSGHSILVRVVGFKHYAYYLVPKGFSKDDLKPMRKYLNDLITESDEEASSSTISRIDIEKGNGGPSYLKIMVSDYHDLKSVQDMWLFVLQSCAGLLIEHFKTHIFQSGRCKYRNFFPIPQNPCDGKVPYHLRYMSDKELKAMSWLKLLAKKYKFVPEESRLSSCQLEVSVHDEHVILSPENEAANAPLRILSFDIETNVPADLKTFPSSKNDPIITIGNTISTYGRANSEVQAVFTLGSCSPISGATVVSCEDEADLLLAWKEFVTEVDPDIILGHNITRFDMPYLLGRAIVHDLDEFPYLGRLEASRQVMEDPNASHGWNEFDKCPGYVGRFVLDLCKHGLDMGIRGSGKTTLNALSKEYLGDKKEDLSFKQIPGLQAGSADDRRTLATYCLKDTLLPLRLMDKMGCLPFQIKKAREAHLPLNAMREKPSLQFISQACYKRKAEMENVTSPKCTLDGERALKRQRSDA